MGKSRILHKWNRPKEIDFEVSRLLIKTGRDMLPRLILVIGIILLLLYLFLSRFVPEEVFPAIRRGIIGSFICAQLLPCGFLLMGLLRRYLRTRYEICENKIVQWDWLNTESISWRKVRGYSYSDSDHFLNMISIELHLKNKKKMALSLQKGELSEQVLRTFSERCQMMSEDEDQRLKRIILKKWEMLYLLTLSLAYAVLGGYILFTHKLWFLYVISLLVTMLLGPGTLGCFLLCGMRILKDKAIRTYAIIFNAAGMTFMMFSWVLFELYYWSDVIRRLTQVNGMAG